MKRKSLNLPVSGIFHVNEIKAPEIPWQDQRAGAHPGPQDLVSFSGSHCFLCGTPLAATPRTSNQDTGEDVFAKWMQEYFDLASLPVTLQDGTTRTYSEVLIPCCAECNGCYLSRIEDRVRTAFGKGGFARLAQLRKADLFLWCTKIYYGLMHLEVQPRHPRTKAPLMPSMPEYFLKDLGLLLLLLQGFRKRVVLFGSSHLPFSLLLLPIQTGRDPSCYFHVRVLNIFPAIVMQLASVGIISVLDDFGLTEEWYRRRYTKSLRNKTLHPDQFWELAGRATYHSQLMPVATSMSCISGEHDMMLTLHPRPDQGPTYDSKKEAFWIEQIRQPDKAPVGLFWDEQSGRQFTTLPVADGVFHEIPFVDISTP